MNVVRKSPAKVSLYGDTIHFWGIFQRRRQEVLDSVPSLGPT